MPPPVRRHPRHVKPTGGVGGPPLLVPRAANRRREVSCRLGGLDSRTPQHATHGKTGSKHKLQGGSMSHMSKRMCCRCCRRGPPCACSELTQFSLSPLLGDQSYPCVGLGRQAAKYGFMKIPFQGYKVGSSPIQSWIQALGQFPRGCMSKGVVW